MAKENQEQLSEKKGKWDEPREVSGADQAFGRIHGLMPLYTEVPAEFRRGDTKWNRFISDWFFRGCESISGERAGIDKRKALAHIGAVLGSFEPKHEHKEAGCAYLASLWFPNIEWTTKKVRQP